MKNNRRIINYSGIGLLALLLLALLSIAIIVRSPFPKVRGRKRV